MTEPRVVHLKGEHLYELAGPETVARIAALAQAPGSSVPLVAKQLGLEEDVVQAAVKIHNATPAAEAPPPDKSLVAQAKDVLVLLGTLAGLVYFLGGAVLFARLSFADLPKEAVFAQLPREFLFTVGVGQVLVWGAIVVGFYAILRLLWLSAEGEETGPSNRWRRLWVWSLGVSRSPAFAKGLAVFWLAFLCAAPIVAANVANRGAEGFSGDAGFWIIAEFAILGSWVFAVLIRYFFSKGKLPWNTRPPWLTLALAYGLVVMVAATATAATLPFMEARACMSTGFREGGVLVGQTSDRIFLGEPVATNRRIASLPSADVEELFIGPNADRAACDPRGRAAAVTASLEANGAAKALRQAEGSLKELRNASTAAAGLEAAEALAIASINANRAGLRVAETADRVGADIDTSKLARELGRDARELDTVADDAREAAVDLLALIEGASPDNPTLGELQEEAARVIELTRSVEGMAQSLADQAFEVLTEPEM